MKIVGLCGSLRAGSLNARLMRVAGQGFGAGFVAGDLRLPLYDGDVEAAGLPESVTHLADLIAGADGLIIASPEYNKGPSGVLKNALDWLSRVKPNPLYGKPAAMMSASAGRSGGERMQAMLRLMLAPHRMRVLTYPEVLVGNADTHFDGDTLITQSHLDAVAAQMAALRAEIARG
jgi:chromate reductase